MGFSFAELFLMVFVTLLLIFGPVALILISGNKAEKKEKERNDNMPVCTVNALVQKKFFHQGDHDITSSYHVTFELENRNQHELTVPAQVYNKFLEGDRGKLSFQGTRYIGFQRAPYGQPAQSNVQNAARRCPYCMSIVTGDTGNCSNCGGNL